MSLKRLTVAVVLVELLGLGVLFAFVLGAAVANGGTITLDVTLFGEQWIEYWIMLVLTATVPYVLYVADQEYLP